MVTASQGCVFVQDLISLPFSVICDALLRLVLGTTIITTAIPYALIFHDLHFNVCMSPYGVYTVCDTFLLTGCLSQEDAMYAFLERGRTSSYTARCAPQTLFFPCVLRGGSPYDDHTALLFFLFSSPFGALFSHRTPLFVCAWAGYLNCPSGKCGTLDLCSCDHLSIVQAAHHS